jgi:hypothetical protein
MTVELGRSWEYDVDAMALRRCFSKDGCL